MGRSPYIDPLLAEADLSESDLLLRKAFVTEYMKCRSAYHACLQLGFLEAYATDWAKSFMGEGIVRRLIADAERTEDSEDLTKERRSKYRAWMETEATYRGPGSSHGARVTAISNLMKMEGIDAPVREEDVTGIKGGVMMVPAMTDPDSWGELASNSQANLKAVVKD